MWNRYKVTNGNYLVICVKHTTYLKCVGNISTAYALTGPIAKPSTGIADRNITNKMSCVTTLTSTQKRPIIKNTEIRRFFLPMILTVLLTTIAMTAQAKFATELIRNVLVSSESSHSRKSSAVYKKEKNESEY